MFRNVVMGCVEKAFICPKILCAKLNKKICMCLKVLYAKFERFAFVPKYYVQNLEPTASLSLIDI